MKKTLFALLVIIPLFFGCKPKNGVRIDSVQNGSSISIKQNDGVTVIDTIVGGWWVGDTIYQGRCDTFAVRKTWNSGDTVFYQWVAPNEKIPCGYETVTDTIIFVK